MNQQSIYGNKALEWHCILGIPSKNWEREREKELVMHQLPVIPNGINCLPYQMRPIVYHTKWDQLPVIPNGTNCLPYQMRPIACHNKWDQLSAILIGTNCLPYQMGPIVCHTKWDQLTAIPNGNNCLSYQMGPIIIIIIKALFIDGNHFILQWFSNGHQIEVMYNRIKENVQR